MAVLSIFMNAGKTHCHCFCRFVWMLLPRLLFVFMLLAGSFSVKSQDNQTLTQLKVKQLIEKKAEYHRLSGGDQDGYRIKIHFGVDRDQAHAVRTKFSTRFTEFDTYEEYQQPNFVILVGDYKTKLEAYQSLKKIQGEFPNAFIVKDKIRLK
jgi:hypothetical protein